MFCSETETRLMAHLRVFSHFDAAAMLLGLSEKDDGERQKKTLVLHQAP